MICVENPRFGGTRIGPLSDFSPLGGLIVLETRQIGDSTRWGQIEGIVALGGTRKRDTHETNLETTQGRARALMGTPRAIKKSKSNGRKNAWRENAHTV